MSASRMANSAARARLVDHATARAHSVRKSRRARPIRRLRCVTRCHATKCLIATDDEAYNKRINRLAPIQNDFIIVRAIQRGVSNSGLRGALGVNVPQIRQQRALLHGICPKVVELLKDKHISSTASTTKLKQMRAGRQIEAAELMLAANNFTTAYARALLAAHRRRDQLLNSAKARQIRGSAPSRWARMEREMANLQRDLKLLEDFLRR